LGDAEDILQKQVLIILILQVKPLWVTPTEGSDKSPSRFIGAFNYNKDTLLAYSRSSGEANSASVLKVLEAEALAGSEINNDPNDTMRINGTLTKTKKSKKDKYAPKPVFEIDSIEVKGYEIDF
jgi:hypothetical protein